MSESSVNSDHFLVRAKVEFSILVERPKRIKCTKKIYKKILKRNQAEDYKEKINEY